MRIKHPGAVYHVTSCGDGRKVIDMSDRDREMLLVLVEEDDGIFPI